MSQVVMVHSSLQCDVLADTNGHILRRGHIDHGRVARIGIGNPEGNGELVGGTAEDDRQSPCQDKKEGGEPSLVGCTGQRRNDRV